MLQAISDALRLPVPRRRHINGRIVEVGVRLVEWIEVRVRAGPTRTGKMGTCAIYTSRSETDERHSYYSNASYPENI